MKKILLFLVLGFTMSGETIFKDGELDKIAKDSTVEEKLCLDCLRKIINKGEINER